jgi:hypothetical protein
MRGLANEPEQDEDDEDEDDEAYEEGGDEDDADEDDEDSDDDDEEEDEEDDEEVVGEPPSAEWSERKLCDDGACVGVIGSDGKCTVCGKRSAA